MMFDHYYLWIVFLHHWTLPYYFRRPRGEARVQRRIALRIALPVTREDGRDGGGSREESREEVRVGGGLAWG
jgi:hypothetical protein